LLLLAPVSAWAEAARLPPAIEALTAPLSDTELAGAGCLVASSAAAAGVVVLAGGLGPIGSALQGPLSATRVLEGGAALAFLFSSACYIGQALAPVAALSWSSISSAARSAIGGP